MCCRKKEAQAWVAAAWTMSASPSLRSWLQRTTWSRQLVDDVASLLRFGRLPPTHERSPRVASKLKRLVGQLRSHHSPKVEGSQQSGVRITLEVDGERRTVVPLEEVPALVDKTFRSPLLGAGRGRDALFDKLRRAYIGVSRRRVGEALKHMAERLDMQDLRFLAVAVTIQQQSGGNLAEILAGLAKVIRARFRLFRRVKAITAEAKWSGKFLSGFPLVCLALILVNDPGYYDDVMDHPYFIPACFVVGILLSLNLVVMRVLTNIKV